MNWYYIWDKELRELVGVGDDNSIIAWLCSDCAEELGDAVSFASSDDLYEHACWRCGLYDDDPYSTRR